jgi:pimeloyl-ACP methyl ester carboxylesterase
LAALLDIGIVSIQWVAVQFLYTYIRMLGFFKKAPADPASPGSPAAPADPAAPAAPAGDAGDAGSLAPGERYDTTLRPTCFGLPIKVTKEAAAKVGPDNFKKYEYLLYIGAQLSRLVYCDTGIMWHVIEKSLGMSNDVVNKVISTYDKKFLPERRKASSAPGSFMSRPMESYSLKVASPDDKKYATYISTPSDLTCLILNASKIIERNTLEREQTKESQKKLPESILQSKDIFVSFKGSSTLKNLWHDLKSQFTASDLGGLLQSIGVNVSVNQGKNLVTGAFVKPIVKSWNTLMSALSEHITADDTRLFLCGHSLGGAYCTLFAFILAEGKVSGTIPIMEKVKNIHILSYGAPTLLSDTARNTFNRHLESGLMTLDRVVSQKVAARTSGMSVIQGLALGAGPNDIIPSIPAGFAHPGFRPLATNWRPEANGRPYSIDNIRNFYGISSKTRYRDIATWPFMHDISLGDWNNSKILDLIVKNITGEQPPPNEDPTKQAKELSEDPTQSGGLFGFGKQKGEYAAQTQKHIPDFVSIAGSNHAIGFAHAEYLGMFFLGGFRLAGMKNPGFDNHTAYFNMYPSGIQITYIDYKVNQAVDSVAQAALPQSEADSDPAAPNSPVAATNQLAKGLPGQGSNEDPTIMKGGYKNIRRTRKARKVKPTRKMKKQSKSRRR